MSNLKFAETHNLVAFLEKPKESDGFDRIIDFLNASSIRYALTIQALVDGKKVIITEMSVRRALQLKDAGGTESLPNATIFAELERTGYENLPQKLTFYKAFFSPQWKFLIHKILQCLSAKTTAWNEFSSTMASAIIYVRNQKKKQKKILVSLMKMKSEKSKAKGVTMQEPSKSGKQVRVSPPQIDLKDKGKAKMVEPEKPEKKKDQIEYDADVAHRLQAELDKEDRLERERKE
ncbi:hypothetical protein Tco_0008193 [Tanacetum coccineum]